MMKKGCWGCISISIYIYICICIYVCIYIYVYIYMYTLIDWDYMAVICGPHTLPRYTSQNGSILLNVASDAEGNKNTPLCSLALRTNMSTPNSPKY